MSVSKEKVLVDVDRPLFYEGAMKMLSPVADLHFQTLTIKSMAEHGDAVAIIAGAGVMIDDEFLHSAPRLKIVARYGVGYDNVDVEACTGRGVYVTITYDALSGTVADLAICLMLCLSRGILKADRFAREEWAKHGWGGILPLGSDLEDKTLGIVGMGRVGFEVTRRAYGFKMNILYCDIVRREAAERQFGARRVQLEELLRESDYVTIHVPLRDETKGLIGRRELSLMKETAYLINTSRGAVVDQKVLTEFLKNKRIAGAGLDVFHPEPPQPHDLILQLDNVVLTPHVGSATHEARRRMSISTAKEVLRVLRGERPVNLVPEQVGKIA
ncbi:MAG: Glyoxylate reductase [Candidatus Bathyarchaeota archaeon BA1]|nr:MAG: Glyoxylate reductase [Candidatus Bathyarchaeota archaeon BA1]